MRQQRRVVRQQVRLAVLDDAVAERRRRGLQAFRLQAHDVPHAHHRRAFHIQPADKLLKLGSESLCNVVTRALRFQDGNIFPPLRVRDQALDVLGSSGRLRTVWPAGC